jgi:hypothetical protein
MPDIEALREVSEREQRESDQYDRHLAAEIMAMLPYAQTDATRILGLVHEMLTLRVRREPKTSN